MNLLKPISICISWAILRSCCVAKHESQLKKKTLTPYFSKPFWSEITPHLLLAVQNDHQLFVKNLSPPQVGKPQTLQNIWIHTTNHYQQKIIGFFEIYIIYIYICFWRKKIILFFFGGVDFFTPQKKTSIVSNILRFTNEKKTPWVGFEGFHFCFHGLLDLEKCLGLDPDDFLQEVGGGWKGRREVGVGLVWGLP